MHPTANGAEISVSQSPANFHLPFGRFRGRPLRDVPSAYLQWVAGRNLTTQVDTALRSELLLRGVVVDTAAARPTRRFVW